MSWLEIVKALIAIASWLLRTKAENEARAAGVNETLARALSEASDAIDKARIAREAVRDRTSNDPGSVREHDEFERRD